MSSPETPSLRVANIPVMLDYDYQKLVGKGRIEGDKIIIEVEGETLVEKVAYLAEIGHVRGFSLGLEYIATRVHRSSTHALPNLSSEH